MGLDGIVNTSRRRDHFRNILTHLGQHQRGSPEWLAESFLKTTNGDPAALLLILNTFVNTPLDAIRSIKQSTLVVCGSDDSDNGSALDLAQTLPAGNYVEIPGGHMSSVTKPELGRAIADFVTDDCYGLEESRTLPEGVVRTGPLAVASNVESPPRTR